MSTLLGLARPAVVLAPGLDGASGVPGSSRIGGNPDLPPGTSWPERPPYAAERAARYLADADHPASWLDMLDAARREEVIADNRRRGQVVAAPAPLAFVAQVDLAQVAAAGDTVPELPAAGRLLLFYDLVEMPWGYDPAEHIGFRLLFDDSPEDVLERRELPAALVALGSEGRLPELPLLARPATSLPPSDAFDLAGRLGEADATAYRDLEAGLMDDRRVWDTHRVGGWPHQVQGEMQVQCALVAAGHDTGDTSAYLDEQTRAAAEREAPEWVLVLQVASDDDHGFMWGDSGFLYVWMRRADLAARAVDRAVVILQSF